MARKTADACLPCRGHQAWSCAVSAVARTSECASVPQLGRVGVGRCVGDRMLDGVPMHVATTEASLPLRDCRPVLVERPIWSAGCRSFQAPRMLSSAALKIADLHSRDELHLSMMYRNTSGGEPCSSSTAGRTTAGGEVRNARSPLSWESGARSL